MKLAISSFTGVGQIKTRLGWMLASVLIISGCTGGAGIKPVDGDSEAASVTTSENLPDVELTPDVLYDILVGEIAGQQGQLETAVTSLMRAARETRDPRLAARATRAAVYAKDLEAALQASRLWVELSPESIEARELLAKVLLDLGKPVEAELHLGKALAIAKTRNNLGKVFLHTASLMSRQSNRKSAFEVMEALVNRYPDLAQAHLALAHLGVRAGNQDRALIAIEKALDLNPGWQDAALYKARILIGRSPDQAEAFYRSFLSDFPRAAKVRLNYARFLVDRKQWQLASKQFKRILKTSPNDADAVLAVGLLSLQAERYKDAETYLMRHLKLQPDNDQARLYLGQVAEELKNYTRAEFWYQQITSNKYYFEAQTRLAVVLARMDKLESGRKVLHSLQANTDRERVQLVLVEDQILREARNYVEALKVLNRALKGLPDHTEILYARALVAEKLDDLKLMESDLRQVLEKDPKNVHALNALGYTLADRTDRLEEAEVLVSKALEMRPDDAFILDSMGWVHYRLGNYDEALRFLKRALSISNDAEISAHLGEVLWTIGEHNKARTIWRRAFEKTPNNETLEAVIKKFGK